MQLWLSHVGVWRVWDECLLWEEICQTKEAQEKRGAPEPEVFTAGLNVVEMTWFALKGSSERSNDLRGCFGVACFGLLANGSIYEQTYPSHAQPLSSKHDKN